MAIKYSIVVPAYNEEAVIGTSLVRLSAYLKDQGIMDETEVIVVSADGTDKTHEIVLQKASYFTTLHLVKPGPKVGKGRDVREGIRNATGDFVLFTDADLATPEYYIVPAFKKLESGYDVVIGSRDLKRIHPEFYRTVISLGTNLLTRILLLPTIPDTQCGFKGFTKSAATDIFDRQTIMAWGFDMEILKIAKKLHLKIFKLKIPDWHDPKIDQGLVGESGLTATWRTFKELITIRVNSWEGLYDKKR